MTTSPQLYAMLYKFDIHKFAEQMLPPRLRSKVLLALLRALLTPLKRLIEAFRLFRDEVLRRLRTTGQTYSLEWALNKRYQLPSGAIYITDTPDKQVYLFFEKEGRSPKFLHKGREAHDPFYLSYRHEGKHDADFIVHIPSFLRSEEAEIRRIINFYKPAGRTYKIDFYDYE